MSEIMLTRTLEVIGAEIRALTASMLGNVIEIGRRMVEAKELLPHGEFGPWIKENTGYSNSTANNFMRLFLEYGNKQSSLFGAEVENFQTFGNLSYTKALALLALPSEEEREEFVETHDVESMSTRELQAAIRERDEARKAAKVLQLEKEDLDKGLSQAKAESVKKSFEIQDLKKKIEEIESRPVEVAVQEPDPDAVEKLAAELANKAREELEQQAAKEVGAAEEKAAKAAEALKKAQEKAKAEREKLEAQLKEAEGKISAAGEADRAEAEKLRAEAEALRKQLAMSGEAVTIFKLRYTAWQDAHRAMMGALAKVPEGQQEKLAAAVEAQLKAWRAE